MIIDGHAHACGVYLTKESIDDYWLKHNIDMVVLSCGEPNSSKNYSYPMLSDLFHSNNLCYHFNKIICTISKLNHLSDNLDAQNKLVSELSDSNPNRIINTYWVNPLESNCLEKMIEDYPKYKFKMIKLHQCWCNFDISSKNCSSIFLWAALHNMPVFIHLLSQNQVIKFVSTANKFFNTTFIVAHIIGIDYMKNKLNYKNVYFDLSAPQLYSSKLLKDSIKYFGVNRFILGSDTPYGNNNIEKILLRLKKLSLSSKDINLISGTTLASLLSL